MANATEIAVKYAVEKERIVLFDAVAEKYRRVESVRELILWLEELRRKAV